MNSSDNLETALRDFYSGKSLSREKFSEIRKSGQPKSPNFPQWAVVGAAALFLLGILIGRFIPGKSLNDNQSRYLARAIAYQHAHDLPIEYLIDSQADARKVLAAYFSSGSDADVENWFRRFNFMGYRRCLLDGEFAMRFRVEEKKSGIAGTLFVLNPDTFRTVKDSVYPTEANDFDVTLWRDSVGLYGLALNRP